MGWNRGWRPYVPVSRRRAEARRTVAALRKRGVDIQPVEIGGRGIAETFWGKAWCDHLEAFGDFENRLPRGRTYVRNGSVCHLDIAEGKVGALVSGTEMYHVEVRVRPLAAKAWAAVRKRCAGRIGSLLELLQGRLSHHVMEVVTDRKAGLFPQPREITFDCDCPDWADMCKHVAAVCYGVGARLDLQPELLFLLRGVDHQELIDADAERVVAAETTRGRSKRLADDALGDVFGIDLADEAPDAKPGAANGKGASAGGRDARRPRAAATKKRSRKKVAATKKAVVNMKAGGRKPRAAKRKAPATKKAAVNKKAGGRKPRAAKRKAPATKKALVKRSRVVKKKSPAKKKSVAKKRAPAKRKTARR